MSRLFRAFFSTGETVYFCSRRRQKWHLTRIPRLQRLDNTKSIQEKDIYNGSLDFEFNLAVRHNSINDYSHCIHRKDTKMLLYAKSVSGKGRKIYRSETVTSFEEVRHFHMKIKVQKEKESITKRFGLHKTGPFKSLTSRVTKRAYKIVKLSTKDSKTIVSNNVENEMDRLYLQVFKENDEIKVAVAEETSYFEVTKLNNKRYVFKTISFPSHALKYDKRTNEVIVGKYDVEDINRINLDFQFQLHHV